LAISRNLSDRELDKFQEDVNGNTAVRTLLSGAIPSNWDNVTLSYTGDNVTLVVYSLDSTVIRTLTLGYVGDNLTSVTVT